MCQDEIVSKIQVEVWVWHAESKWVWPNHEAWHVSGYLDVVGVAFVGVALVRLLAPPPFRLRSVWCARMFLLMCCSNLVFT